MLNFTHVPRSFPATDCYQNLHINQLHRRNRLCKSWCQLIFEFLIDGCPKMPVTYQNDGDHYNSWHYHAAVISKQYSQSYHIMNSNIHSLPCYRVPRFTGNLWAAPRVTRRPCIVTAANAKNDAVRRLELISLYIIESFCSKIWFRIYILKPVSHLPYSIRRYSIL